MPLKILFSLALSTLLLLTFALLTTAQTTSNTLRGQVVDATTGERIARAKVVVQSPNQQGELSTTTDDAGLFVFDNLITGEIELTVSTVNYALLKRRLTLKANEETSVTLALSQEAATLQEEVTVSVAPFDSLTSNSVPSEQRLTKTELAQTSSVIVSDPLRAAQALPGVVANDDFRSEFAVRGAGFDRAGLFVDDAQTDNFVYTVRGYNDTGSLSIINGDALESVALLPGAYPARYGDSTAGAVVLETREGNRVKRNVRVGASVTNVNGIVDAPFANKRGAYLFSARKSFAGLITRRLQNEVGDTNPPPVVEFADVQGKVVFDLNPKHKLALSAIFGDFDLDVNIPREQLGINALSTSGSRNLLLNFAHTYTPNERIVINSRLINTRLNFANRNLEGMILDDGTRTQTGVRSDASFNLARFPSHRLEAGIYLRSLGAEGSSSRTFLPSKPSQTFSLFDERRFEQAYYAQDAYTNERLNLTLTGGARVEHSGRSDETFFMPRAGLSYSFGKDLYRVRAGFGTYRQFPDFNELFGINGNPNLKADRATHYNLSFERFFGQRTRLLVETYNREERRLAYSLTEPRIAGNAFNFINFPFRNALDGYARGIEITAQRRSANGLTGFASYAYSRTRLRDEGLNICFPSDFDQPHTITVFGNYRFTDTFNLSAQWRAGTGTPVTGFYREQDNRYFLSDRRNEARIPAYSRVDIRAAKTFLFDRFRLTLNGEVLNVLNRDNLRFIGFDGFDFNNGRVFGNLTRTLPVLPSAGVVIEF
ncbi:MAG: TonB-dependent receptor [Pyrinomonadaceae bacterium MAG19_C2-C3]|nr:TonB-dependent receptor [Pyrinomonadaceae bacterium MAG19_C2-C3]